MVGIVGSAKSGTAAAVQNLLQRSTTIAQLGECHGWSLWVGWWLFGGWLGWLVVDWLFGRVRASIESLLVSVHLASTIVSSMSLRVHRIQRHKPGPK